MNQITIMNKYNSFEILENNFLKPSDIQEILDVMSLQITDCGFDFKSLIFHFQEKTIFQDTEKLILNIGSKDEFIEYYKKQTDWTYSTTRSIYLALKKGPFFINSPFLQIEEKDELLFVSTSSLSDTDKLEINKIILENKITFENLYMMFFDSVDFSDDKIIRIKFESINDFKSDLLR